ncbi:MAG: hypothetical protein HOV87_15705 [Catenulispora sp.]|nr:hypothetical protein [Catenulispora sp.]
MFVESSPSPTDQRPARRLIRLADGAARLRMMAIAGIATVLITRAYLAATGYPKVGGGTIHIGHVLWGGLLMIAALTVGLVWVGERARNWTALLGGVGVGLFVDEVGKYLTTTNDYFYRPAAAIIYLVFAALLVVASLLGRDTRVVEPGERVAAAAQVAADGLVSGLTSDEWARAVRLLDGCAAEDRAAIEHLLTSATVREPGRVARFGAGVRWFIEWVVRLRYAEGVVFALLVLSHGIVAVIFTIQAVTGEPHPNDGGAVAASAVTRGVAAVVVVAAVWLRLRSRRAAAYRLARAAVLLDLLVTEIFNFHDSQFGAVAELPWLLVALLFLTSWQRKATDG